MPCTDECVRAVQVEKELSDICSSILSLLDEHLIPTASSGESKVFYLKMKGDYHRYLAEFKTSSDRKDAAEHTLLAYKAAQVSHRSSAAQGHLDQEHVGVELSQESSILGVIGPYQCSLNFGCQCLNSMSNTFSPSLELPACCGYLHHDICSQQSKTAEQA